MTRYRRRRNGHPLCLACYLRGPRSRLRVLRRRLRDQEYRHGSRLNRESEEQRIPGFCIFVRNMQKARDHFRLWICRAYRRHLREFGCESGNLVIEPYRFLCGR